MYGSESKTPTVRSSKMLLSDWATGNYSFLYSGRTLENAEKIILHDIEGYIGYGELGPGFYVTPHPLQAVEWALVVAERQKVKPVLVRFHVNWNLLDSLNFKAFLDEDVLYYFKRETYGDAQLRYIDHDCLVSYVDLPISNKQGVQIKFQSDRGLVLLNSFPSILICLTSAWTQERIKNLWRLLSEKNERIGQ